MGEFEELVMESRHTIQELLRDINDLPSYMLEKQLNFILRELEQMLIIKNANLFYPYYPKGIADWSSNNRVGIQLLEILDAYRRLGDEV